MDGLDVSALHHHHHHHHHNHHAAGAASQALVLSAAAGDTDPMLSAAVLATSGECCLSPSASSSVTSTMLSAHHHNHNQPPPLQQQPSAAGVGGVGGVAAFYYDDENIYSPPYSASAVSDYYGSIFNQCTGNSRGAFGGSPVAYEQQRVAYGKTSYPTTREQQQQLSNYYGGCALPFGAGDARLSSEHNSFDKGESGGAFSPGAYSSMRLDPPAAHGGGVLVPSGLPPPSASSAFSEEDGGGSGFAKDGHHHFSFPDDGFVICGMTTATSDGRSSLHSYSSPTSSSETSSALYCSSSGDEALFHSSGASSSFLDEEETHSAAALLGDVKPLDFDAAVLASPGSGAASSTILGGSDEEMSAARIKYEYDGRKPSVRLSNNNNNASAQLNGIGEENRTPLITYTTNRNNSGGHLGRGAAAPTTTASGGGDGGAGTTIIRVVTNYASRNDTTSNTTTSRLALRLPKVEQFAALTTADDAVGGERCSGVRGGTSLCLCGGGGVSSGGEAGMGASGGCGSVPLASSSCSPGSSIASTINSVVIKNTVSGAFLRSQQYQQPCQIVYRATVTPARGSGGTMTVSSQSGYNNGAQYHYPPYADNGISHSINAERPSTYSGISEPLDENDGVGGGGGGGLEPLLDELNTRELAQRISQELKRYSIPQAIFAQRVLCRSQGTLSDLLRNPKPWSKLKSGRETFRRMAKWLQEPEFQRMSALRLAACKRKEETRESGTHSPTASTSPPRSASSTATASGGGAASYPLPLDNDGGGTASEAVVGDVEMTRQCREASLVSSSTNADERTGFAQRSSPAAKKPRLVFTDIQRRTLHAIFKETKRPSRDMQLTISQQLGLDPNTVANFFMNARRRGHDRHAPQPPSGRSADAERERDAAVFPLLAAAAAATAAASASASTSAPNVLTAAELSPAFSRRTTHHFPSTVSDGRSFGSGIAVDASGDGSCGRSGVSSCNSSVCGYAITHHESRPLAPSRRDGDAATPTPTQMEEEEASSLSLLSAIHPQQQQQPVTTAHTVTSSSSSSSDR